MREEFLDRLARLDQYATGRKVRAFHKADKRVSSRVRSLDEVQRRVAQFGGIVGRNVRRHADRDTRRSVRQQIGELTGEHDWFALFAIVGLAEIDGVLVEALEQQARNLGHPRFGVAHRRRVISVDVAEVPLPFDQRVANSEFLREANQRVIDRGVAVRWYLPITSPTTRAHFLKP